jgi:hypothetical protein
MESECWLPYPQHFACELAAFNSYSIIFFFLGPMQYYSPISIYVSKMVPSRLLFLTKILYSYLPHAAYVSGQTFLM